MVKITLSKQTYDLLMTILEQVLRQANADFSQARLNSSEEAHASLRISVLFDIIAALVSGVEVNSYDIQSN